MGKKKSEVNPHAHISRREVPGRVRAFMAAEPDVQVGALAELRATAATLDGGRLTNALLLLLPTMASIATIFYATTGQLQSRALFLGMVSLDMAQAFEELGAYDQASSARARAIEAANFNDDGMFSQSVLILTLLVTAIFAYSALSDYRRGSAMMWIAAYEDAMRDARERARDLREAEALCGGDRDRRPWWKLRAR